MTIYCPFCGARPLKNAIQAHRYFEAGPPLKVGPVLVEMGVLRVRSGGPGREAMDKPHFTYLCPRCGFGEAYLDFDP